MPTADYCRQIEIYLCQKNDGHLIRIAGPSFDLVSSWEARGVPVKVACRGIDRYFDRYYARGPRRRPVRIDFCDADVLDVFDEWRRATGLTAVDVARSPGNSADNAGSADEGDTGDRRAVVRRGPSLPAHMERALRRLTSLRAAGTLDGKFDDLLDRVARELDCVADGVRGANRRALIERLAVLDRELLDAARAGLDEASRAALNTEADDELSGFRSAMSAEALERARQAVVDRLIRERSNLPTIAYD